MSVYCLYLLCIYKYKHDASIYLRKIVYILNIFIYNIKYNNINIQMYIHVNIFKIYTVCVKK